MSNTDKKSSELLCTPKTKTILRKTARKKHKFGESEKCFTTAAFTVIQHHAGERLFCCDICDKRYMNKNSLNRHMKVHGGKKPHSCADCSQGFCMENTPRANKEEKKFVCELCQISCTSKSKLIAHMNGHNNIKRFECSLCQKRFTTKKSAELHHLTHTKEKPHKCTFCRRSFPNKQTLRNHLRIHTGEKPYSCDVCHESFTWKFQIQHHMVTHMEGNPKLYECSLCKKRFATKKSAKQHDLTHTKPHKCTFCGRGFPNKLTLRNHLRIHTGEKPYSCDVCHTSFCQMIQMERHMVTHMEGNPKLYECSWCQKRFTTEKSAIQQDLTHTKPHKCIFCGKSFAYEILSASTPKNTHWGKALLL